MAVSNAATQVFEDGFATPIEAFEAAELSELLQAVGDPSRLGILSALGAARVPVGASVAATGFR